MGVNKKSINIPEKYTKLVELSHNMWFSWNIEAVQLFKMIDEQKWNEVYHNPVRMLMEMDADRWSKLEADKGFNKLYKSVVSSWENYMTDESTWFKKTHPHHTQHKIAYFSAEFGFHSGVCQPAPSSKKVNTTK